MAQPVADVARFELVMHAPGIDEQLQTFHIARSGGWTGTTLFLMAEELADLWNAGPGVLLPTTLTLDEIRYQDLTLLVNPTFTYVPDPAPAGDSAATMLPYVVPGVVQLINGTGDEPSRTYINHGPLAENYVDANTINNTARNNIGAAYNGIRVGIPAFDADAGAVLISRTLAGVERVPPAVSQWSATSVRPLVGRRQTRLR